MARIHWKRNSCLDGARVTLDAYVSGRRAGQIASTVTASGKRAWDIWVATGGTGTVGDTYPTLAKAKAELASRISPQPN